MLGAAIGLIIVLMLFMLSSIRRRRHIAYRKRIRSDYQKGAISDSPHSFSNPEYYGPTDAEQSAISDNGWNFGGGEFGGAGAGEGYDESSSEWGGGSSGSDWNCDSSSDSGSDPSRGDFSTSD